MCPSIDNAINKMQSLSSSSFGVGGYFGPRSHGLYLLCALVIGRPPKAIDTLCSSDVFKIDGI